ncbi:UNVERIFIED_CONTAM: hypothetical protein GTU68_038232 [Idotea baltica]|nr:hypothetical protein [Idotea baltica]
MTKQAIKDKANNIKLVIFDVDGVLTDGGLYFDNQGQEYKAFNSKDGLGIRMLMDSGVNIAIITGRKSDLVKHRAANLKISPDLIYQGYSDKRIAYNEILEKTGFLTNEIAYVGDDLIDLPVMSKVGFAISVGDAHWFVKEKSHFITEAVGGRGAAREVCELILSAQGKLDHIFQNYLDGDGSKLTITN